MKVIREAGALAALSMAATASAQVVFTRWDFNGPGLSEIGPAAVMANQGSAAALLIGGVTPRSTGAFSSDLGASDAGSGSAWDVSNFPVQGTASGTAGLEFRADATGYSNVTFEFDLRPTGRFSDYISVQYSLNQGAVWTPFVSAAFQLPGNTDATATVWTNNLGSGVGALPLFAFPAAADGLSDVRVRVVTVFDPVAGSAYSPNSPVNAAGATQTYLPSGSVRLDMVEFKGVVSNGTPPLISMGASGVSPGSACAGLTTPVHIALAVVPGAVPASGSLAASADVSAIGGPASVAMVPMGIDLSGRWLFALDTAVAPSTPAGTRPIPVAAIDNLNRSASGVLEVVVGVCCPADLDNGTGSGVRDGGVDINDLLFFLARFEQGDVAADLDNGSGTGTPDGGVDINDLLYFLVHFEAGC